jgi:hypothetical protein
VPGDVRGLGVVELGCGRRTSPHGWPDAAPGRPGVDVTPAQLESARHCQDRFGISFPLIEAYAADVLLPKVGTTSPAFPTGNMYKCPEPAYIETAWHFLAPPWRAES